jgi:hypothetical protein
MTLGERSLPEMREADTTPAGSSENVESCSRGQLDK